jgi:hypothetical protein
LELADEVVEEADEPQRGLRPREVPGAEPISPEGVLELFKIGTDTSIVTIRGVYGHDRACHGLLESLHPATRIMCGNEGMIARRSFGTTAIRRHTMTERSLQRDGFIWEVRSTLDE